MFVQARISSIAKKLAFGDLGSDYGIGRERRVVVTTTFRPLVGLKVGDVIECELQPSDPLFRHAAHFGKDPRIVRHAQPDEGPKQAGDVKEDDWASFL